MKKGGKIFTGIVLGGVLALTGLSVIGCNGDKTDSTALKNTTEVYGFAGATTGLLASNKDVATNMLTMSSVSKVEGQDLEDLKNTMCSAISDTLDKYMNVFDSVVGGSRPVDVEEVTSDKDGYRHKMTITTKSIDGTETVCVLYFNETLSDDDSVEIEDINNEKRETKLVGELYVNGSETPLYVEGKRELEDNEMEVTFEVKFNKEDNNNKVVFKQEIEKKNGKIEEEYEFELVIGDVSTEFSFDFEKDAKGNLEVEYEQVIGGQTISFEIEKTANNEITIKTEDFFGLELEIKVTKVDDASGSHYVYSIPMLGNLVFDGSLIK